MLTCFPSLPNIALCVLLVSAASASAQDGEPAAASGYRQAINRGVAEYSDGQFERASASFELAQSLWPNARPLRGLGKVAFAQHHYVAAIDYFQRALESNVHPLDASMKREVEELRTRAQNAVAQVYVEVEPAQAEITIDERSASLPIGKPLQLDPGDHQVLARAQGYVSERHLFTLQAGEHTSWLLSLERDIALPRAMLTPADAARTLPLTGAAQQVDSRPQWLLPVGATLSIAGLATAGAAIAFVSTHFEDSDKVSAANDQELHDRYGPRWHRSRATMFAWSGAATGLLSVGAGLLADYIPREQRAWLTPTLAAAGGVLLASGLSLYGANRTAAVSDAAPQLRVHASDRADAGSLLVMLSAPLLTIPLMQVVAWLSADK